MNFEVILLGSGVSTGVPSIGCILSANTNKKCNVCEDALINPYSKNRRNNVSIVIRFTDKNDGMVRTVVIDVGKTMRDGVLTLFRANQLKQVDAIFLTHGHADAIFGMDDVRDLQESVLVEVQNESTNNVPVKGFKVVSGRLPIFLHQETMDTVRSVFGYLVGTADFLDEKNNVLKRRVALLDFIVIPNRTIQTLYGMKIEVFPVYHGGTYISLGFAFGNNSEFVYISDFKIIPDKSMAFLKSIPKIQTLILDALNMDGIYSHAGILEAVEVVRILQPEQVYLTGMSCSIGMHDDVEEYLRKTYPLLNIKLAFDGMKLFI